MVGFLSDIVIEINAEPKLDITPMDFIRSAHKRTKPRVAKVDRAKVKAARKQKLRKTAAQKGTPND